MPESIYSMNALIRFGKDTVLIKVSEFCFYSLMKAFLSESWIFPPLIQSEMHECRPSFITTYIHLYIYIYTHVHTLIYMCAWACACVCGLLSGKISKCNASEPMPPLLLLF